MVNDSTISIRSSVVVILAQKIADYIQSLSSLAFISKLNTPPPHTHTHTHTCTHKFKFVKEFLPLRQFDCILCAFLLSSQNHIFEFASPLHPEYCTHYTSGWGTAVAQWLRCCATNRKVVGSIPDGVIGIPHWHKSASWVFWQHAAKIPNWYSEINVTFYGVTLARTIWLPYDGLRTETCRCVFNVLMCKFYKFYICAVVGIIIE